MAALIDTLNKLIDAAKRRDKADFLKHLDPNIEYHYHVGSRPLIGHEWVEKFLDRYWATVSPDDSVWRIDRYAENGNVLLVEGYEEFLDTTNNQRVCHPYMSTYEFRDGLIIKWRDYFEMKATNRG